jgi:tetratricopeptide repeat protein 21B
VIECEALIASKQKADLEQATKLLNFILSKNKDYVPALVTMGLCKFIQKKSTDARNYLKEVIKGEYQI